jgi:hypothetical protein
VRAHTHTRTYTSALIIRTCAHAYTHTHTHVHTQVQPGTSAHVRKHTHTRTYTSAPHTYTLSRVHTHTLTYTHKRTHTRTRAHTRRPRHTFPHVCKHPSARARARAHTYTHTLASRKESVNIVTKELLHGKDIWREVSLLCGWYKGEKGKEQKRVHTSQYCSNMAPECLVAKGTFLARWASRPPLPLHLNFKRGLHSAYRNGNNSWKQCVRFETLRTLRASKRPNTEPVPTLR